MTVLHYINKLKPSHSCGHDNIRSNILKIVAMAITPCLTLIINQVLSTGQFQKNLKTAKVIPIHKTGDKSLIFWGKKIFIVSKQKNRQKIQKIDIYNIHKLYTK